MFFIFILIPPIYLSIYPAYIFFRFFFFFFCHSVLEGVREREREERREESRIMGLGDEKCILLLFLLILISFHFIPISPAYPFSRIPSSLSPQLQIPHFPLSPTHTHTHQTNQPPSRFQIPKPSKAKPRISAK